jgi:hypothetical protein
VGAPEDISSPAEPVEAASEGEVDPSQVDDSVEERDTGGDVNSVLDAARQNARQAVERHHVNPVLKAARLHARHAVELHRLHQENQDGLD